MPEIRLQCCIFGCRRTTTRLPDCDEFICQEHWSAVPKATRKRHLDIRRAVKADPAQMLLCRAEMGRAWGACKNAAMAAAGGLC